MNSISDKAVIFGDVNIKDSAIAGNAVVGDNCDLKVVQMSPYSEFGRRCVVRNTSIGQGSYVSSHSCIESVEIGKYCCISSDVNIYGVAKEKTHNYKHASMYTPYWFHRVFDADMSSTVVGRDIATIGSDVWIGCNTSIVGNVHIGHGAVIGAGSVVVDDVAPYTIVAGNPAREIRKRFPDDVIKRLLKLQWWDYDRDQIKQVIHLLSVDWTSGF